MMSIFSGEQGLIRLLKAARDVHFLWIERDVFIASTARDVHFLWIERVVFIARTARDVHIFWR